MEHDRSSLLVIGASAGGVQPLLDLVAELPADFPAPVLVVVHIGTNPSMLPELLRRAGSLPATHAIDREPLRAGHIYVAPPDFHLVVEPGRVALSHGPRENHSRPAIDPLFRSAARHFGPRAIGVILSGALSDGAAGLVAIKTQGGVTIVQDPTDALVSGMPTHAIDLVEPHYVLPAREIGRQLARMDVRIAPSAQGTTVDERDGTDARIQRDFDKQRENRNADQLTMFTCPDCGGSLWQMDSGKLMRFQCHVGHAWGPEALLGLKSDELEAALWSSVRLLKERSTLSRQVAIRMRESGLHEDQVERINEQATLDETRANAIRTLLDRPLDLASQVTAGNIEAGG